MSNAITICSVCGIPIRANNINCPKCGCKFPAVNLFANQTSFLTWKKYVSDYKNERNQAKVDNFRKRALSLFSNQLGITDADKNSIRVYFGDKTSQLDGVAQYSVNARHSVFLRTDGTVYAEGSNDDGQCDLKDLKNIRYVYAGANCTYLVDDSGDVIIRGYSSVADTVREWHGVKKIVGNKGRVVALTEHGDVLIADDIQKITTDVHNAVDVDTTYNFTVWLYDDGKVGCSSTKENDPRNSITEWTDILSVGVESYYVVGLKKNGTVVYAGKTPPVDIDLDRKRIGEWRNVIAIACSNSGILSVMSDGTVDIVGNVGKRNKIREQLQAEMSERYWQ